MRQITLIIKKRSKCSLRNQANKDHKKRRLDFLEEHLHRATGRRLLKTEERKDGDDGGDNDPNKQLLQ